MAELQALKIAVPAMCAALAAAGCQAIDWTVPDDAVFSPGCDGEDADTTVLHENIAVGELEREYVLRLPGSYRADFPFPLVFAFHGAGSNGTEFRDYIDIEEATRARAIFVYPDARPDVDGFERWDGDAAGPDTDMYEAVRSDLTDRYCIDESRVFLIGYSSGAGYANALACARPQELRGVAPVAGGGPWADCGAPLAAVVTHGAADPVVDITNGVGTREHWRQQNGCSEQTEEFDPDPCVRYLGCDEPVIWCEHQDPVAIAHGWPRFVEDAIWSVFGSL